ncbi:MAG: hypothetical protein ABFC81_05870 [Rectinema sp.]
MKNAPKELRAHDMMLPGVLTAQGFLGMDERPVGDIIAEDETEFAELKLDFDAVADKLAYLRDSGEAGLGEPVTVRDIDAMRDTPRALLVQTGDARGMLPCPYGDGLYHKNGVSVRSADMPPETCVEGEDMLVFSDLSIHLLREHHFCQGRGSPFRLDASLIAKLLFS